MMEDIFDIKQNLFSRLMILKNQYPDCLWLNECVNMNKQSGMVMETRLTPEVNIKDIFISPN